LAVLMDPGCKRSLKRPPASFICRPGQNPWCVDRCSPGPGPKVLPVGEPGPRPRRRPGSVRPRQVRHRGCPSGATPVRARRHKTRPWAAALA